MSQLQVNRINDASGGVLAPISSVMRNRIINGAMVIDQRNAGASVTPINTQYLVDRFSYLATQASKFSAQQNAGSVTPPIGFNNYQGLTVIATQSLGAGDFFGVSQKVEGFNISDLGWGTANAKTVTLSFWVRSSLTGTFGGSLRNSAGNRSYPFSYTISAANTWEYETITIAGDTSGTWLTNNGIGIDLFFSLGTGSTFSGTGGAWTGSNLLSATGATSVVGTNGATFYITGVQLEVGTQATSFEYRQYGTELSLCQRYAHIIKGQGGFSCMSSSLFVNATTNARAFITLPVTMRAAPTATYSAANTFLPQNGAGINLTPTGVGTTGNGVTPNYFSIDFTVSGATVASSGILYDNNTTSAQITLSAEL